MSDKKDLTRIEDLSAFLHEEDPDVDAQLDFADDEIPPSLPSVSDLDEDNSSSFDTEEESSFDSSDDSFSEEETSFDSEEKSSFDSKDEGQSFDSNDSFESDEDSAFGDEGSSFGEEESSFDSFSDDGDFSEGEDSEDPFALEESSFDSDGDDSFLDSSMDFDSQGESSEFDSNGEGDFSSGDEFSEEDSFNSEESIELSSESTEDQASFEEDQGSFDNNSSSEEFATQTEEENEETVEGLSPEKPEVSEPPTSVPESQNISPTMDAPQIPQAHLSPPSTTPAQHMNDLKDSAKAMAYGPISAGGNPPFGLIVRNIKFKEDGDSILGILKEVGLLDDSNMEDFSKGVENGSLLISQISEFSAIILTHKFRRFDVEILMGLSEEIHPSKNYSENPKGLITKESIYQQSFEENRELERSPVSLESILLSTTQNLEGHKIHRYLGVVSSHKIVTSEQLNESQIPSTPSTPPLDGELLEELSNIVEQIDKESRVAHNPEDQNHLYEELAYSLKEKALGLKGNAVIGINYAIAPIVNPAESFSSVNYKITCTGNVVWVTDKGEIVGS